MTLILSQLGIKSAYIATGNYVPSTEVGGHIAFGVDPVGVGHLRSFLSAFYLLNQWVDFDQTCTDTLLGGGKEVI